MEKDERIKKKIDNLRIYSKATDIIFNIGFAGFTLSGIAVMASIPFDFIEPETQNNLMKTSLASIAGLCGGSRVLDFYIDNKVQNLQKTLKKKE